ncbi:hypothetical protein [Polymorphospora rubra]|uniref:hypothetical protein n=1 Tax=Polymorphospora rubra TaxID=338584 RepID=UPI0033C2FCC3
MGLDAYVYCRCWQDGLATPPPVGPVGLDEEGYLDLLLPWEGNEDAHTAFDTWVERACPHEQMEQAGERVSNWAGLRLFQQTLEAAGWSHFPTLHAGLPSANGGWMPAEQAARVLDELEFFAHRARIEDEVVLVDEATGRELMTYVAAYCGVTMLGPGYRAGVDPDGFFVLDPDADPPVTLFRASRFEQRVLPDGQVEFTGGGTTARVAMPPIGERRTPPPRLRVESRPRTAADFDYVVGALRRLCEASVATGNPVMWC